MSFSGDVDELLRRIVSLQSAQVVGVERQRQEKHQAENQMDSLLMGIVEALDLLETVKNNPAANNQEVPNGDQGLILRKVKRRLTALLEKFDVTEIQIEGHSLTPGLVRVLEARGAPTIEVCRKGFRRGSRVLRPVEVVT